MMQPSSNLQWQDRFTREVRFWPDGKLAKLQKCLNHLVQEYAHRPLPLNVAVCSIAADSKLQTASASGRRYGEGGVSLASQVPQLLLPFVGIHN
jgi:hypothetical protein